MTYLQGLSIIGCIKLNQTKARMEGVVRTLKQRIDDLELGFQVLCLIQFHESLDETEKLPIASSLLMAYLQLLQKETKEAKDSARP